MGGSKFNGVLQEVLMGHSDIDVVAFLEDKLQLPPDKAEQLAARIQKKYPQKTAGAPEPNLPKSVFERIEKADETSKATVYSVRSLSEGEFDRFMKWLLEQLGYEIQSQEHFSEWGINFAAVLEGKKVAFQIVRCPKTCRVSYPIVDIAQAAKRQLTCEKAVVIATGNFTEQAAANAQKAGVELWDENTLSLRISEVREKADLEVQSCFPKYQGSLLQSLLCLGETKHFLVEAKAVGKYDLHLPGVKYPLLTFQVDGGAVSRCVYRIKDNEPVGEADGEALIAVDATGRRVGSDDIHAYGSIMQYLVQFLE